MFKSIHLIVVFIFLDFQLASQASWPTFYTSHETESFNGAFPKFSKLNTGEVFENAAFSNELKYSSLLKIVDDKKMDISYQRNDQFSFKEKNAKTKKEKNKYPAEFSLIAGASFNSFKVSPYQQFVHPTTLNYQSKVSPVIGFSYTEYGQRSFGKNMYSGELRYYNFRHAAKTVDEEWEYKANVFTVGIAIGRKWIYEKNFSWYTSIVPSAVILANNKEIKYYQNSNTVVDGNGLSFRAGIQMGFILFNHLGIWALYNVPGIDLHDYRQYSTIHKSTQAGIDWRFQF
jgi:hypothetical protein